MRRLGDLVNAKKMPTREEFCVKKACVGDGGELERALGDVFGIKVTVRSCCKSCSIQNGKLLPNLSSPRLFLSAFHFHQPRKFPGQNLRLKKVSRGKPHQFSKRGLGRSQMGQTINKNKFSFTLPDLAFGFVHKRSGNEITR